MHFGVVMVLNLMNGLLTSSVGMVLYVLARVSGAPLSLAISAVVPFLFPALPVRLLINFIQALTALAVGVRLPVSVRAAAAAQRR